MSVEDLYRGEQGEAYHRLKHSFDRSVYTVVARNRARKLQPFVRSDDSVLEYGVGTGLNLIGLVCRKRAGYDISAVGRQLLEEKGITFISDESEIAVGGYTVEPGGRMILCVPFETLRRYRRYESDDPNHHVYSWNAQSLGNLVASAGFTIKLVAIRPFGYEQRLAAAAKVAVWLYRTLLLAAQMARPVQEIRLVAETDNAGDQTCKP
jgi:hypothetical protein